jgi:hypothetical protein
MTTEIKARNMTPKGFLHKSNCKAGLAARAFIAAHKEYLITGEVAYKTSLIVEKMEAGELMPSPALDEIKRAVLDHILEVNKIDSFEAALDRASAKEAKRALEPSEPKKAKPFMAVIRDGAGVVCLDANGKEMKAGFDLPQRAIEWCDRRLFQSYADCFGEVIQGIGNS